MGMENFGAAIKPAIGGLVVGAAGLAIVGFNWGGWVTGKSAMAMSETAVVERLVPICVGQFNKDANKVMKLAEMKKGDSWKRGDFVSKQGWATMPGSEDVDPDVAEGCAEKIAP